MLMDSSNASYRPLTLDDRDRAARVIAQAFVDDPLCIYMLPFARTRVKTLTKFMRAYGEIAIKAQRAFGAGEPLQAAAFWVFPDQENLSIGLKSLSIFLPLLITFYPIGYFRAKAVLRRQSDLHKKYAPEPHFALDNIGVLPSAHGRGLSSRLIRPFLEMADAQKVIVYTDTLTRSNVGLYEHFGFQCVEECPVPGTGLTVWALRRPVQG